MHKINNFWTRIKSWSLTKKIIYGVIILIVIYGGYKIFSPKNNSANITTDFVKFGDLKETILATGQVTSTTDLSLSFDSSGTVHTLKAKVGDKVKAGTILATLDQGNVLASLTSARGALAAAQARYKKIIEGASNEEISLSEIALQNAKLDYERIKSAQEVLVSNAYKNLLNSTPEALPSGGGVDYTAPTISGNYTKGIEGKITISIFYTGNGSNFSVDGIASGGGIVTTTTPQLLGDSGLYIKFPSTNSNTTEWTINIPNKKAPDYVTNYNLYQSALKTQDSVLGSAQSLIDQRTAELTLKKSTARDSDKEAAQADILSAQGGLQGAQANFEHTVLRAPTNGTITKINIKLGELSQISQEAMVLQDIDNLYLEANINEANIENVKISAPVSLTFDSFGTENTFTGKILKVDPASTVISGVVNYKVTASIDSSPNLRPGMTANMTILVGEKNNILMIPSRAVITDKTGKKTVRLITNTKTKAYKEIEVATGIEGDGGIIEITTGIKESDEIVILIKK